MFNWNNEDDLTRFFDMARANQAANRINFAPGYATLLSINDCLALAGKHLTNTKPIMSCVLLLRCQYAYKTAVGLALAGQVVEAFAMTRLVLEYSGYALAIAKDSSLEDVFISRHQSDAEMKVQKEKFKIGNVRAVIAAQDATLAENFDLFYQRAIDFGGHPNPHGAFSAMTLDAGPETTSIMTLAITADPKAIAHAIKSVAQAGFTALYILQHAFTAKFELLGLRTEIDRLRNAGGL